MELTPHQVEERLARLAEGLAPAAQNRQAAVAIVLRFGAGAIEVLLMTRAERQDDHWSGHISLPGGHQEAGDADLLATALRETCEEVGVDLERCGRLIGRLQPIQAQARGRVLALDINPLVFVLEEAVALAPGPEAVEAFWFPLHCAAAGKLDDEMDYQHGPVARRLPCWRYQGRIIWGLTYKILRLFLQAAGTQDGAAR